jgi:hypothetical protein
MIIMPLVRKGQLEFSIGNRRRIGHLGRNIPSRYQSAKRSFEPARVIRSDCYRKRQPYFRKIASAVRIITRIEPEVTHRVEPPRVCRAGVRAIGAREVIERRAPVPAVKAPGCQLGQPRCRAVGLGRRSIAGHGNQTVEGSGRVPALQQAVGHSSGIGDVPALESEIIGISHVMFGAAREEGRLV